MDSWRDRNSSHREVKFEGLDHRASKNLVEKEGLGRIVNENSTLSE